MFDSVAYLLTGVYIFMLELVNLFIFKYCDNKHDKIERAISIGLYKNPGRQRGMAFAEILQLSPTINIMTSLRMYERSLPKRANRSQTSR